ncbi:MAG: DUF6578 domain-containing protein [Acidimicrobiales bacterium]
MVRVWVDNWQMQCCGTPLRVGVEASFEVLALDRSFLSPILGEAVVSAIGWAEERHGHDEPLHHLSGWVTGIEGAFCRYELREDGRMYEAVAGSGRTERLELTDGYEDAREGDWFMGYIVEIE